MSVEIWILIAIVIFGGLSIFTLLSVSQSVTNTSNKMTQIVSNIEAIRKAVETYPRPETSRDSHDDISWIRTNTGLIHDDTFGLKGAVDGLSHHIGRKMDELMNELMIRFPPPPSPYDH